MNQLLSRGKRMFLSEQTSILSAATIIMIMTVASQILGFVRQRVILHFFTPNDASLFSAAFRLPDLVFEVLIYGMFSSAFIPVFTRLIKKDEREAWDTAGRVVSICLVIFGFFAIIMGIWADVIYANVAPGYSKEQIHTIASLARVMFISQGIFIVSYVLTSVLESLRRFLIPALAPLFYNLGLILGTIVLAPRFGLMGPAVGVIIGALIHFMIQLPLALKLGFRFKWELRLTSDVKDVAKLAAPRLIDLSFQQIAETAVLYFSSLISVASYTYFSIANLLQLAPVRLFGTSLAKAALPTLTRENENFERFRDILFKTIYQIFFLVTPIVAVFIVLRIPTVRLFFGTSRFDWNSTVETGMVLSAFAVGIPFQAFVAILARGFYAIHDTKTPVLISVIGDAGIVIGDFIFVRGLGYGSWALALSFSLGAFIETIILVCILKSRLKNFSVGKFFLPMTKTLTSGLASGIVMYYLLKSFDKWVPIKIPKPIAFDIFVLDTRYTGNLIILTVLVGGIGLLVYIFTSFLLKSNELNEVVSILVRRKFWPYALRKNIPINTIEETMEKG